jgi:hypothetical protein
MKGLPKNPHFKDTKDSPKKQKQLPQKKDKKQVSEAKWLEKRVRNPETGNDVKIRTLKNKPRDSMGHQFYLQLLEEKNKKTKKTASVVVRKALMVQRIASKTLEMETHKMASMQKDLETLKREVTKALANKTEYPLEIELGRTPRLFLILEGAEGDVTEARKIRQILEPVVTRTLDKLSEGYMEHQMRSFNRGEDLVLEIEILFP